MVYSFKEQFKFYVPNRFKKASEADGLFQKNEQHPGGSIPSTLQFIDRVFQTTVPLFASINFITVQSAVPLVKFINNWSTILEDFDTAFDKYYKINLQSLKKFKKIMSFVILVSFTIPQIKAFTFAGSLLATDNQFFNLWFKISFVGFISSAFILSTFVTLLSLVTIWIMYREVEPCFPRGLV